MFGEILRSTAIIGKSCHCREGVLVTGGIAETGCLRIGKGAVRYSGPAAEMRGNPRLRDELLGLSVADK